MPEETPPPTIPDPADIRARLTADIAAGKTIALSAADLSEPGLRERLPLLLDELSRESRIGAPGVVIPGYTILAAIGQGGMSTVHLARHEALGRHVALKIGTPSVLGDEKGRKRLRDEAQRLARVRHPNIVTIHDVIEVDNTIVIAMEWVDGLTLAGLLRLLPPSPTDDDMAIVMAGLGAPAEAARRFEATAVRFLVRMMHDIARALHCVHEAEMVHLDVKPSNVLLRRDGTPLLADFGVGRELRQDAVPTHSFAGTPVYSAPEQLRQSGSLGAHTDVYGLGVTLYEALARCQPLQRLDLAGLIQTTAAGRQPRLSTLTSVAQDLETVVHKAMSPEPSHRYPTAAAFADDLLNFLEHRPVSARPLTRMQLLRRWARNEPWKAALAIVLALTLPALVGLGTYLAVQLPRIEVIRQQEQQAKANRLKQAGYRAYFGASLYDGQASSLLHEAMELDPGDSSLACLLSMILVEGRDARSICQQHTAAIARHLGLQFLALKVEQGHAFFRDDEAARLRQSDDPVDHYVLALDRVAKADDSCAEDAWLEAVASLRAITMVSDADPMVFCLQAWCTMRTHDRAAFDDVCRAMHARWPDNNDVWAWQCLSIEVFDPPSADRIAHWLIENDPDNAAGWELFVGWAVRLRSPDVQTRIDMAAARGIHTPVLRVLRTLAEARGNPTKARQALSDLPPEYLSVGRRLHLLHQVDPDEAKQYSEQVLAEPTLGRSALSHLHDYAVQHGHIDLAIRIFDIYHARFPDHRGLHNAQIELLYKNRSPAEAAPLVREFLCPRYLLANRSAFFSRSLMAVRDWQGLADFSLRWVQYTTGIVRSEGQFYLGLALSRLGRASEAAPLLAAATAVVPEGKTWYLHGLLELAWIRADPAADPLVRDTGSAASLVARFETMNAAREKPLVGPWTALVCAEVSFANGDAAGAQRALARGGFMRRLEQHAPANTAELVQQARERYAR